MEEMLRKIGLTDNEIKVYMTLLRIKSGLAGEITKVSGIHRRSVYDAIERLIQKGLVSYAWEGKRKYFQAEKPDRILDIITNWEEEVKDSLPKLNAIYEGGFVKEQVITYRGKNGLKSVMDDQIEVGKDIYIYGAYGNLDERLKYFFAQFEKRRIKKKIHVQLIFDENERSRWAGNLPLVNARFMPAGFSGPVTTEIYGDRVIILHWLENPIIFMMKSQEVARAYRKYFDIIWKNAKR
jgi:sugar-specific transcriptional regulator TrmB